MEGDETTLYYTLQNSKVYQEKDLIGMQIHEDVSERNVLDVITHYSNFN